MMPFKYSLLGIAQTLCRLDQSLSQPHALLAAPRNPSHCLASPVNAQTVPSAFAPAARMSHQERREL